MKKIDINIKNDKNTLDELNSLVIPEWNAPKTPVDGVSIEEKNEHVDYREVKEK